MQLAQSVHAAFEFSVAHPARLASWHSSSNTVVIVVAPDEMRLGWLVQRAKEEGYIAVCFHEPDLSYQLTAVALEPRARHLASHLPLAMEGR